MTTSNLSAPAAHKPHSPKPPKPPLPPQPNPDDDPWPDDGDGDMSRRPSIPRDGARLRR